LKTGSQELVRNVGESLIQSVARFASGISTVGELLIRDQKYRKLRDRRKQVETKNVGEGLLYGTKDMAEGIIAGLTGPFVEPVFGAKEEGPRGVARGIGRGLAGLVVKPVMGVGDFFQQTTKGLKNQFTKRRQPVKRRLTRFIGEDGVIRVTLKFSSNY